MNHLEDATPECVVCDDRGCEYCPAVDRQESGVFSVTSYDTTRGGESRMDQDVLMTKVVESLKSSLLRAVGGELQRYESELHDRCGDLDDYWMWADTEARTLAEWMVTGDIAVAGN